MKDKQDKPFGYVKDIFSILLKYSLEQYLTFYLETGNFPSKTEWKRVIKSEIFRYESHQWTNRTIHDSDITRFIILHNGTGLQRIWKFAWSAQQSNIIKVITKFWTITPTRKISTCQLYNTQCTHIFKYVACNCAYFSTNRDLLWSDIINFDLGICAELCALDEEELYTYLLGKIPATQLSEQNEKELILLCGNYLIELFAMYKKNSQ